ncbi:Spo11/DNA topoisomerase VI subunit A, partial [Blastocladiella britannica]
MDPFQCHSDRFLPSDPFSDDAAHAGPWTAPLDQTQPQTRAGICGVQGAARLALEDLAFEFIQEAHAWCMQDRSVVDSTRSSCDMLPPSLALFPTPLRIRPPITTKAISEQSPKQKRKCEPVRRAAAHVQVMAIAHRLTATATKDDTWATVTRRAVYYCDPALFGSQRIVDVAVNSIASTLVHRLGLDAGECISAYGALALGILPGSRSIAIGNAIVDLVPRSRSDPDTTTDLAAVGSLGALLPSPAIVAGIHLAPGIGYLLVVEKETVFAHLAALRLVQRTVPMRGILVTSKGFPDTASRGFIQAACAAASSGLRVCIVADGDPYGVHIALQYLDTLGPHSDRAVYAGVTTHHLTALVSTMHAGVLPMTNRDRVRARNLLRRPECWSRPELRRVLQTMMHLNAKVEVEALGDLVVG